MSNREDDFLQRLLPALSGSEHLPVPPGDDCAVVEGPPGKWWAIAVDQVVADVHFHGRRAACPDQAELAGRKLLARNLSDLAAMGAEPLYAVVALTAARDCPDDWLWRFMGGLRQLAEEAGLAIIGGDLAGGPTEVGSLTIIGELPAGSCLTRGGARPGDEIWVTGSFGGAWRGDHHLRFAPRLEEGAWLRRQPAVHAAIDASDGLAKDLQRLCLASQLDALLAIDQVPLREWADSVASAEQALFDGEDYELIVAVDANEADNVAAAWPFPTDWRRVGSFTAPAGETPLVRSADGQPLDLTGRAYDHFGGGPD